MWTKAGIIAVLTILLAATSIPPSTAMANEGEIFTVIKSVNIRASAGTQFKILGVLKKGERVHVVGRAKNDTWLEVSRSGTYLGFVYHSFLKAGLPPSLPVSKPGATANSTTANLLDNLLGGKSSSAPNLTSTTRQTVGGGLDGSLNNLREEMEIAELERQIQAEIKAEIEAKQDAVRRENQRIADIQQTANLCNWKVESISADLQELGDLLSEFECMDPSERMMPIAEQIREMGFSALGVDFARACVEDVEEEREDLSDDIMSDIEYFRDGDCEGDGRHRYLRKALNGINGNISDSLQYYSNVVDDAKNRQHAYRRQEDERIRAEGQEWLNNLFNTSKAFLKQNQQMMKDTAAAYDQSIQIRDNQARLAQQESDSRQLAQQQQIQAQNDQARQQLEVIQSNANKRLVQLRKQRAEALARLEQKKNRLVIARNDNPKTTLTNNTGKSGGSNQGGSIVLGSILDPGAGSNAKNRNNEIEALAYCWQNDHERWLCDGKVQRLSISVDSLDEALGFVHCQNYRKQVPFSNGHIYFCNDEMINLDWGTGKLTPNRDISAWYPIPPSILSQRRKGG